jgi:hypothetical protein
MKEDGVAALPLCPAGGCERLKPSAVPKNGAVQGEATIAANTPPAKERRLPVSPLVAPLRPISPTPISNTPKRFRAGRRKTNASTATMVGFLQLESPPKCLSSGAQKQQGTCKRKETADHTRRKDSPCKRALRKSPPACSRKPMAFREITRSTQGIRFRISLPKKAKNIATKTRSGRKARCRWERRPRRPRREMKPAR